jgi:hypothetical protein
VDDLSVPPEFFDQIDFIRAQFDHALAPCLDSEAYRHVSVFIDPIDGTREFSTGPIIS